MSALVSVIIPCYNGEKYLQACVESVLAQTHTNIECIIVDDGSTDQTPNIARSLIRRDPRVRYLAKANGGAASARNYGIFHAKGEWIQLLDADDVIHHEKIAHQLSYLPNRKGDATNTALYSDYDVFWEDDKQNVTRRVTNIIGELAPDELLNAYISGGFTPYAPLSVNSVLMHKSLFADRTFDEQLYMYEDMLFFLDLLVSGTVFIYTPMVGMSYRRHRSNTTRDLAAVGRSYIAMLSKVAILDPSLFNRTPHIGRLAKKAIYEGDNRLLAQINALLRQTGFACDLSPASVSFFRICRMFYNIQMLHSIVAFIRLTRCPVYLFKNHIDVSSFVLFVYQLKRFRFFSFLFSG